MRQRKGRSLCFGMLAAASLPTALLADNVNGRWGQPFGWPLIPLHATLLPDGKVFAFGTNGNGDQGAQLEYSVWNFWEGWGSHRKLPNTQGTDIFCSATGLLPNGDVLIAGGDTRNPANNGIKDALVFRNGPQDLQRTANLNFARWYPTLTTLPNGETLIFGGRDGGSAPVATPEVYGNGGWRNLWGATNWDIINNDEGKWFYPRNWVAPNGRVFGMTGNVMYFLDWGAEGGTQIAGQLPNKSRSHTSTAVMYQPGKILQVGGSVWGDTQAEGSRQAITVDVTSGWPQVQDAPDMGFRRIWANSTVLANGEVLITGGSAFENKLVDPAFTAEMWNPHTRQFRRLAASPIARMYHSVSLLLPDGSVMVGGGGAPGPLNNLNAEIYWPPYLFDGGNFAARPAMGDFNVNQDYNNTVNIPFGGAGGVARVTLVRTGSATHSFDMSQRFLDLGFHLHGGTVAVTMPHSPNIAPPGHYMLFFINHQGVPSVAKILSLTQGGGHSHPHPGSGGAIHVGETYSLVARFSGKCVDVPGGGLDKGIPIHQWGCNGTGAQRFRVHQAANGAYNLVNVQSNRCLDVSDVSAADGQKILQWDCTGGANQAVRFTPGTDGSYQVKFEHSGKCMDVSEPHADDGTPIHQWTCFAGAGNQEYYLRP